MSKPEGTILMSWGIGHYRYEQPGGLGFIVVIRDKDGHVRTVLYPADFEQLQRKAGAR